MTDPWSAPAPFRGTRFVCPFDDWHYDESDEWTDEIPADTGAGASSLQEALSARTFALLAARYRRIEAVVRAHVETHTLEEWFAAAVTLQRVRHGVRGLTHDPAPSEERIDRAFRAGALTAEEAVWINRARALLGSLAPAETESRPGGAGTITAKDPQ